jgi:hypothetical protein
LTISFPCQLLIQTLLTPWVGLRGLPSSPNRHTQDPRVGF